jgi:hypothetical protein
MAQSQIFYWKDIPSLVRAMEGNDEVTLELDPRFQEHIDAVAMRQKIAGTDEYLDHWHWGEPEQREGSAQEVADALKRELEEKFPLEF